MNLLSCLKSTVLSSGLDLMDNCSPPWILFCDDGKPVAILPAMRPGEVADVSHLDRETAQLIVNLVNAGVHKKQIEALEDMSRRLKELDDLLKEGLNGT
jgi:hypothetical protein